MGKFTGKKRRLNYKPILWIGGIALPVIVAVGFLVWPKRPVLVQFETGPVFNAHVSPAGSFRVDWKTNLPTRGSVFYRFTESRPYDEVSTQLDTRGAVSIPAAAGQKIEFYVEVSGLRTKPVRSENFQVELLPPLTTRPAGATMPVKKR
jgi:hypothetical protein